MPLTRQLSLFGADAAPPEPGDLAGVLIGGGEVNMAAAGVQVSIMVRHPWRAAALVAECARRTLAATSIAGLAEHITVRTAHSDLLRPLAEAWWVARAVRVPAGFLLDGRVLRLWAIANGYHAGGYVLPLGRLDEGGREAVGAALATAGIGAQLVSPRGGAGPSYRIVGRRRLGRLAELVGGAPWQAPAGAWPS